MNNRTKPARMMRIIDKVRLRTQVQPGKIPAFAYSDGTRHAVLPTGQIIRHPDEAKDRSVSGKAARKERIKLRREARAI